MGIPYSLTFTPKNIKVRVVYSLILLFNSESIKYVKKKNFILSSSGYSAHFVAVEKIWLKVVLVPQVEILPKISVNSLSKVFRTFQASYNFFNLFLQSYSSLKWVGVRMTQRQNDTVHHFGTESHFNTATKWHGASLWHSDKMTRFLLISCYFYLKVKKYIY